MDNQDVCFQLKSTLRLKSFLSPKNNIKTTCKSGSDTSIAFLSQMYIVETYVAEWLTPWTLDLEVQGSCLAHHIVSLQQGTFSTLSLFTKCGPLPFFYKYKLVAVYYLPAFSVRSCMSLSPAVLAGSLKYDRRWPTGQVTIVTLLSTDLSITCPSEMHNM